MTFGAPRRPPRLVVRTLIATFCAIAVVLGAAFLTLTIETRCACRPKWRPTSTPASARSPMLESRRQQEAQLQAQNFADSPTLKAALDTYQAETRRGASGDTSDLVATVQHEVEKLSSRVLGRRSGRRGAGGRRDSDVWDVLASGGARSTAWPRGTHLPAAGDAAAADSVVAMPAGTFRVVSAMVDLQGVSIGRLLLATSLDDRYAKDLSALSRAQTAVIVNGRVIASTLDPERKAALAALGTLPAQRDGPARRRSARRAAVVPIRSRRLLCRRLDRRRRRPGDELPRRKRFSSSRSARSGSARSSASGSRASSRGRSTICRSSCGG